MSQKINQTTQQNPASALPDLSGSAGKSIVVNDSETGYEHKLITGSGGGGGGDGDANATYIVNEATASLPNALPIVAGPNIILGSGSGGLEITGSAGGLGGDAQARYVLTEPTGSLTNAYIIEAGPGIEINSGSNVLSISGSTTDLGDVNAEYIVNTLTASLPNAFKLEAGPNITINSGSSFIAISGSSGGNAKDVKTLQFVAGTNTTNTALSGSKQSIGSIFFNPENYASTAEYKWRIILRSSETLVSAAIDIYDQDGIVEGIPGIITGSIFSSSNQSLTFFEVDLTSRLSSVTGSGIFEARIWKTLSGSTTSSVSCASAKIDVETSGSSEVSKPFTHQLFSGVETTGTALSGSKQSVGAFYFDPSFISQFLGDPSYKWNVILRTSEPLISAAIDLYDQNGIINGFPGVMTGSIISSSNQAYTYLESDITNQLLTVTGSGVIETRIWKTVSGSVTSSITCANAQIDVEFS
jgi:hypothetical protein